MHIILHVQLLASKAIQSSVGAPFSLLEHLLLRKKPAVSPCLNCRDKQIQHSVAVTISWHNDQCSEYNCGFSLSAGCVSHSRTSVCDFPGLSLNCYCLAVTISGLEQQNFESQLINGRMI